jgi:DNA-binding NtrC family response regulator/tetratricopeptide (TPR) repeat protein
MRPVLPLRFESVQVFRDTSTTSSFLATDHDLVRNNVVIKAIRKGSFVPDRETIIEHFAWHRGLRHPHIASVLDAGVTPKGDLFSVRDFAPATSMFTSRDMDQLKVLLGAVEFMHSVGRVHGSIKPSNVFAAGKSVQLADAWVPQPWKGPQSEDEVRFSAPEVLKGHPRTIESDLYSVGALLYRFFSGRDLFDDSDLESLAQRHIWASPRPLTSVSYVSRIIADIVEDLISKDPGVRRSAFESLKNEFQITPVAATRAPAIGMDENLKKADEFIQKDSNRLRVLVVEGPLGFGKTRFVEELRHRIALQNSKMVFSVCPPLGQSAHLTFAKWILALHDRYSAAVEEPLTRQFRALATTTSQSIAQNLNIGGLAQSFADMVASIASHQPPLFVLEVNEYTAKILVNSLASHSNYLSATLVITIQPNYVGLELSQELAEYFGNRYEHLSLAALEPSDSRALVAFLVRESKRQELAVRKAGGNPHLIVSYSEEQNVNIPRSITKALRSLFADVPRESQAALELVAVLGSLSNAESLGRIANEFDMKLELPLIRLQRLGIIDLDSRIRYEDGCSILRKRISESRQKDLGRRCYEALKSSRAERRDIADLAFRGGLYSEAASIYRELSFTASKQGDAASTVAFYELVQVCRKNDSSVSDLNVEEMTRFARCVAVLGNPRLARKILTSLLRSKALRDKPVLRAAVYATQAGTLIARSNEEKVRLLRLAVFNTPERHPGRYRRRLALAHSLLSIGNIAEAGKTLKRIATELPEGRADVALFHTVKAGFLMTRGLFKDATEILRPNDLTGSYAGGSLLQLGLCKEELGNLFEAKRLNGEALQFAEGSIFWEAVCLTNLGAVETKLGNMKSAEDYFQACLRRYRESSRGKKVRYETVFVYSDLARKRVLQGNLQDALNCITTLTRQEPKVYPSPRDSFNIAWTKFEVYFSVGRLQNAQKELAKMSKTSLVGPFFEIERLLLEVQLSDWSTSVRRRLEWALLMAKHLKSSYLECRVLIALATCYLAVSTSSYAFALAAAAYSVALQGRYRPLIAQTSLLLARSAKNDSDRQTNFNNCLRDGSSMGLLPLVAECTYHIGAWKSQIGDFLSARDYLFRSVSITTQLAEDLSVADRKRYLSRRDHQQAKQLLEEVSTVTRDFVPFLKEPIGSKEDLLLRNIYKLTSSLAAIRDSATVARALTLSIGQSLPHRGVVLFERGEDRTCYPINSESMEDLYRRAIVASGKANQRTYFPTAGRTDNRDCGVYIPILGRSYRGGIYIDTALPEQDLQFLMVCADLARAAADKETLSQADNTDRSTIEFNGIIGASKSMGQVFGEIEIAARNSSTVLIEGESGTGKELVARAIHTRSSRSKNAFIAVDCGAVPDSLIEAELFGVKKGAYTGATSDRQGLLESANGGTIFLDEIANASFALQTRLLRVLQEREVRRVGDAKGRAIDIRLIAATNMNLETLVEKGQFRADLFFRLKVLHIQIPPLRARKGDIPLLAKAFLNQLNLENQTQKTLVIDVLNELIAYDYPGNVRELQNIVERTFYSTRGEIIGTVPFKSDKPVSRVEKNDLESWFDDLSAGRKNFWSAIRDRYKRRDIPREQVVALVDRGLRTTSGNYKALASLFKIKESDYRRFMDFLRRNDCMLDFRPYRRAED